jgi:hypothetical protein
VQALSSEIDKFLAIAEPTDKKTRKNTHADLQLPSHSQPKSQPSHQDKENLVDRRSDKEYQKRREERLQGILPDEGFPDAIYNESWLRARETDLASDEEVGDIWDDDERDDRWDDDDDDGGGGDGDGGDGGD